MCKYFRDNVLPLDAALNAEINKNLPTKKCERCKKTIVITGQNTKYCPECSALERKKKEAERQRKRRA
jgi:hypothetical protein